MAAGLRIAPAAFSLAKTDALALVVVVADDVLRLAVRGSVLAMVIDAAFVTHPVVAADHRAALGVVVTVEWDAATPIRPATAVLGTQFVIHARPANAVRLLAGVPRALDVVVAVDRIARGAASVQTALLPVAGQLVVAVLVAAAPVALPVIAELLTRGTVPVRIDHMILAGGGPEKQNDQSTDDLKRKFHDSPSSQILPLMAISC
jgi:hypothetical protein